jgi:MFS family permease
MSAIFRSFSVPNFRLWFAGMFVSNTGSWLQRTAQNWLVLTILTNDSAMALGITTFLQFIPQLLLVPWAGVLADRVDRRRFLLFIEAVMAALAVTLTVITLAGVATLALVWALAVALGAASAFEIPVRQAFVSELVPVGLLSNAVALNSTQYNAAQLLGPAIAGLLLARFDVGWVFLLNSASFGGVIATILLLRRSELVPTIRERRAAGQFRVALRAVRDRPDVTLLLVMTAIVSMFGFNFPVFIATMARVEFQATADVFGMLSAVIAVGAVGGALLSARRETPTLRTYTLAVAGFGVSLGAAAVMPTAATFAICLVFIGFFALLISTTANGFVQLAAEPALRGRVLSLYLAIFSGGTPIGALVLSSIADVYGPRWPMAIAAMACAVAVALAGRYWWRRLRLQRT